MTYSLHFTSNQKFLETFVNDVASGGLFIPTPSPAPINAVVKIELYPPGRETEPIQISARVVHRIESEAAKEPQGEAGMGVALLDRASVLRSFKPHIDRLQARN